MRKDRKVNSNEAFSHFLDLKLLGRASELLKLLVNFVDLEIYDEPGQLNFPARVGEDHSMMKCFLGHLVNSCLTHSLTPPGHKSRELRNSTEALMINVRNIQ